MDEFNSDDHYIYYCGQETLRRNGVALIVNKRVQNAILGCNLKNDRMICLFSRQTIQYHSNPSLCLIEEEEVGWFCEDLQDLLELTPQKDVLFIMTSLVAQTVKHLPTMQESQVLSLGHEDPWKRKWQPTTVLLPEKSHGWLNLVGYSPWGCKESDTTERLHST